MVCISHALKGARSGVTIYLYSSRPLCAQDFDFIEQIECERNTRGVNLEIVRKVPGSPSAAQ
ncbi:hypothetical protein [Paraburkholderia sediminicola]|uniref:hypothetical protein n=1 Tax=Paraburkholderia sediminicola TaxID=458836 RepID=UPI0038B722FA